MKKTLRVTPYLVNEKPADRKEFYEIELNIIIDSTDLGDVSHVVDELTKCVKTIEFSFQLSEWSRKLEVGDNHDE